MTLPRRTDSERPRKAVEAVLRQWFWDDWVRLTKTERESKFQGATADLLALPDPVRDAAREAVGVWFTPRAFDRETMATVMLRLRAALEESERVLTGDSHPG